MKTVPPGSSGCDPIPTVSRRLCCLCCTCPSHVDFNSPAMVCDCLVHVYGNAGNHPDRLRRYPSDVTDAEWAAVRPLPPVPACFPGLGGPEGYCHRQLLDAIRYLTAGGISRRAMPADFPMGPGLRLLPPPARARADRRVPRPADLTDRRVGCQDGRDLGALSASGPLQHQTSAPHPRTGALPRHPWPPRQRNSGPLLHSRQLPPARMYDLPSWERPAVRSPRPVTAGTEVPRR